MGSRKIHFFLFLSWFEYSGVVVVDGVAVLVEAALFSTSASASSKHRKLDIFSPIVPGRGPFRDRVYAARRRVNWAPDALSPSHFCIMADSGMTGYYTLVLRQLHFGYEYGT